jgi:hypothetical protein
LTLKSLNSVENFSLPAVTPHHHHHTPKKQNKNDGGSSGGADDDDDEDNDMGSNPLRAPPSPAPYGAEEEEEDHEEFNEISEQLTQEQENQIFALEAAKRAAVKREDYPAAQALKLEIEDLKNSFEMNSHKHPSIVSPLSKSPSFLMKRKQSAVIEEEKEDVELNSYNAIISALQTVIFAADGSVPPKSLSVLYASKLKLRKLEQARDECKNLTHHIYIHGVAGGCLYIRYTSYLTHEKLHPAHPPP